MTGFVIIIGLVLITMVAISEAVERLRSLCAHDRSRLKCALDAY